MRVIPRGDGTKDLFHHSVPCTLWTLSLAQGRTIKLIFSSSHSRITLTCSLALKPATSLANQPRSVWTTFQSHQRVTNITISRSHKHNHSPTHSLTHIVAMPSTDMFHRRASNIAKPGDSSDARLSLARVSTYREVDGARIWSQRKRVPFLVCTALSS